MWAWGRSPTRAEGRGATGGLRPARGRFACRRVGVAGSIPIELELTGSTVVTILVSGAGLNWPLTLPAVNAHFCIVHITGVVMAGGSEKRELKPTEPFWKSTEPARPADAAPAQARAEPDPQSRNNQIEARTLIVGAGMSVSGTITACDRLIAEGTVDAKLDGCQQVIVTETGVFRGTVATDNADVHGRFEGELVVQKRLLVRAGGQVAGTVSYGEIEIECGGKISGQIKPHDRAASSSKPAQTGYVPLTGKPHESGSVGSNGSAPHLVSAGTAVLAAK
jgi:cytoskeletal protein CcmA (bactofilin family)